VYICWSTRGPDALASFRILNVYKEPNNQTLYMPRLVSLSVADGIRVVLNCSLLWSLYNSLIMMSQNKMNNSRISTTYLDNSHNKNQRSHSSRGAQA
jgi:hypothetical protein